MSNKVPRTPFVMEFPAYKRPRLKNVLIRVWNATKNFVTKAGTIIFIFSIIIWALAYFPRSEKVAAEALALQNNAIPKIENIKENEDESSQLANSYLGSFGKIIAAQIIIENIKIIVPAFVTKFLVAFHTRISTFFNRGRL